MQKHAKASLTLGDRGRASLDLPISSATVGRTLPSDPKGVPAPNSAKESQDLGLPHSTGFCWTLPNSAILCRTLSSRGLAACRRFLPVFARSLRILWSRAYLFSAPQSMPNTTARLSRVSAFPNWIRLMSVKPWAGASFQAEAEYKCSQTVCQKTRLYIFLPTVTWGARVV